MPLMRHRDKKDSITNTGCRMFLMTERCQHACIHGIGLVTQSFTLSESFAERGVNYRHDVASIVKVLLGVFITDNSTIFSFKLH